LSPAVFVKDAAAPAVAVAVKTAGAIEPTVADREFWPTVDPRVQPPTVATRLALVVCAPFVTLPPPPVTANVTEAPATAFPFASLTVTDGGTGTGVPPVAVWPSPAVLVIEAAAPAVPVAVNVTGVRLPVDATSVFAPAVVPRLQPPTVAIPDEFVTTAAPETEPPPLPTTNPTATPAIGFPF
jgi:hypothetical protein